jgi:hypothetical protein
VFGELKPETLLCVRNPLHSRHRDLELAIANGADSNGGNLTKPFHHSKIAFRHGQPFWTVLREAFFLADRNIVTAALAREIEVV